MLKKINQFHAMRKEAGRKKSFRVKKGHGGAGLGVDYRVGLALSGGGHRAALFGLGVLMAMVDAGRDPSQISSVSGGSITNAFLAYHYFGRKMSWEASTLQLFDTIVNKGVLTKMWLRGLIASLILPPLVFTILAIGGWLPAWYWTVSLLFAWLSVVLMRGLIIERLFEARFFKDSKGPVMLKDLSSPIEHVICCTDLVSGRPVYFSTGFFGGKLFRRVRDLPEGGKPRILEPSIDVHNKLERLGLTYNAGLLPIVRLVRASAGFPGIPPRRISVQPYEQMPNDNFKGDQFSNVMFLSDGGIWNNLATQPYEDGFLWGPYGPWVVVVADASADLDFIRAAPFHIPGWTEIRALVRQALIQNSNTVTPRRAVFHEGIRRELASPRDSRFKSERLYPVVSCQDTPDDIVARLKLGADVQADDFFLSDSEREWRGGRRKEFRLRLETVMGMPEFNHLCRMAQVSKTFLRGSGSRDPVAAYPTTLDKVDYSTALAIVGRGYANASVTMFLTLLADRLVVPGGWLGDRFASQFKGSHERGV